MTVQFPIFFPNSIYTDPSGNPVSGIGGFFHWTGSSFIWSFNLDSSNNLTIGRYDSNGKLIDSPISIDATTGVVTINSVAHQNSTTVNQTTTNQTTTDSTVKGTITAPNLPTNDPQKAGAVWNNNGVLNVSKGT